MIWLFSTFIPIRELLESSERFPHDTCSFGFKGHLYPIQNFLPIYSDHSRLPHLVQLSISRLWPKSLCKDYITLHPDKPTSPVTRYSNPSTDINWRINWGSLDYLCTYTLIQYHHELTLITNTFSRSFLIPTTSLRMEF